MSIACHRVLLTTLFKIRCIPWGWFWGLYPGILSMALPPCCSGREVGSMHESWSSAESGHSWAVSPIQLGDFMVWDPRGAPVSNQKKLIQVMYSATLLPWSPRLVPLPLLQLFFISPTGERLKLQCNATVFINGAHQFTVLEFLFPAYENDGLLFFNLIFPSFSSLSSIL